MLKVLKGCVIVGLFSYFQNNKKCVICGGKTSGMASKKIKNDACVCYNCRLKMNGVGSFLTKEHTKDDCRVFMNKFTSVLYLSGIMAFSNSVQKIYIIPTIKLLSKPKTIEYANVVGYELLSDNEVITSGGLGRAAVGGALLGWGGAIVGGITAKRKSKNFCEKLEIKITVKGKFAPAIFVEFLGIKTETDSLIYRDAYKEAQNALSQLEIICNEKRNIAQPISGQHSVADEILKYKHLLDMGAITQSEFDKKKKQLLEQ